MNIHPLSDGMASRLLNGKLTFLGLTRSTTRSLMARAFVVCLVFVRSLVPNLNGKMDFVWVWLASPPALEWQEPLSCAWHIAPRQTLAHPSLTDANG